MTLVGTVLANRYRIVRQIGQGGMGAVYEAEHLVIGRRVAIKALHPEFAHRSELVARFHREAQAASRIGHLNIVEVFDFGTDDRGAPFLVMEYLEGRSLAGALQSDGTFPVERSADVVGQTLGALDAAHAKGIIHRDLKPENIFLTDHGGRADFVKLLDFGISKFQTPAGEPKLTTTGVTLGTPYYMAPEQAAGDGELDHRVDVYAMGAVLYEALAGRPPYEGTNYNRLLAQILSSDPPPLREFRPDIPPELARVVHTAMARNRNERYPTAGAMLEALLPFGATRTPFERTATGKRRAVSQRPGPALLPTVPAAASDGPPGAPAPDAPPARAPDGGESKDAASDPAPPPPAVSPQNNPPAEAAAAAPRRSRGSLPVEPIATAPTAHLDLTPSARVEAGPAPARARTAWFAAGLALVIGLALLAWWRISTGPDERRASAGPADAAIPIRPATGASTAPAASSGAPGPAGAGETGGPSRPAVVPAGTNVDSGPPGPDTASADASASIPPAAPADAGADPAPEAATPTTPAPVRDAGRRPRDAGRLPAGADSTTTATPDAGRSDPSVRIGPRDARFLTTYEEETP